MRFALFLLLLGFAACSSFDPLTAPPPKPRDGFEPGGPELPARETLRYRARLGILSAGRANLEISREGETCRTSAKFETTGLVSLLYGVDIDAESALDTRDKLSRSFVWTTGGEEVEKRVEVAFQPENGTVRSGVRSENGVKEVEREAPCARDPFALIYALRRADLTPGRIYRGVVFIEWNIYDAQASVVGREHLEVPAGEFDAVFVRIDLRKRVDGAPEEKSHAMALWLTPDDRRLPVQFALDSPYGQVKLRLTE